jgi:hypothetical protein
MWPRCPDAPITVPLGPDKVLVVELDRLVFPDQPLGLPMAALRVVAAGELDDQGPVVWLRMKDDMFIPTPNAQALAAEIERRRRRVVELGGFAAQEVWARAPSLRTSTLDSPGAPALSRGVWRPLPMAAVGVPSPGMEIIEHPVPTDLPYPEQLLDYEVAGLGVTTHTLIRGQQTVPLAAWHVVLAGRLPDGPAVWLWGPKAEWLVSVPDAEDVAADIRLRQDVSMMFPVSSDLGPERQTWRDFPLTKPVDTPQGRALPPTPAYTPAEPTIAPPGTFKP